MKLAGWLMVLSLGAVMTRAAESAYLPAVWGVEEGLPQHAVTRVIQTAAGDIWCGTFNGLARFDGVKFTIFDSHTQPGLQGNGIQALYEDKHRTLWVGLDNGKVARIVDRVPVPTPEPLKVGKGGVLSFGEDAAGDLWVLWRDATVVRWKDGLSFTRAGDTDLSEPELELVRDGAGGLWLTHRQGFSEVRETGLIPAATGIRERKGNLYRATAAKCGGLWVVAEERLRRWENGAWAEDFGPCPWDDSGPDGVRFVTSLKELRDGRLVAGMVRGGVAIGHPGGEFRRYGRREGLPHEWIRCVGEDREGNLWLGTAGGGLVALRTRRVSMVEVEPENAGHTVQSLFPAKDGSLWVASEGGGLYHRTDGGVMHFSTQEGIPTGYIWAVTEDPGGRIWVGTWSEGLFVREGSGAFSRAPGWPRDATIVTLLHTARDGTLWAGGIGKLARLTTSGWSLLDPDGELLAPPGQRAMAEDAAHGLWIGLGDGRVLHRHDGRKDFYDLRHGMPGDAVVAVLPAEDGVIWLGTAGGGLLRLKDGKTTRFTTAHGLPHDVISQILPGPPGELWLGTYRGICRIRLAELDACTAGNPVQLDVLTLGRSDGLGSLEITTGGQPGACTTADGRLWFPTNQGIAVVDPATIRLNSLPPPVVLDSFAADGNQIPFNAKPPVLGPGISGVAIAYTALSFTAPDRVRFRTRLEGLEKNWEEIGTERCATYRYLPPGRYIFHVAACNNDGVWNPAGASLAFSILPHFWQTGWFITLCGLAFAGVVSGLVWAATRRRDAARLAEVERAHSLERERARIARDIHDDLGSGLTRIMLLSQSARSELSADSPAAAELDNVSRAAERLTRSMDEVVWAVDPRHDSLESLVGYVGGAAQELLKSARVSFRLEEPGNLPAWPLAADCRHGIFLASKEALHNIIRHAGAQTVRVIFAIEHAAFTLTIEDDGSGFDPAAPSTRSGGGCGLANMQTRLAELGGTCDLTTKPGSGTRLIFRIPLKNT